MQCRAVLKLRQRYLQGRRPVGAEVQRMVGGIEVKTAVGRRELIVARRLEYPLGVHARGQTAAEVADGDGDLVLLGGIVEIHDRAGDAERLLETKDVVVAAACQRLPAALLIRMSSSAPPVRVSPALSPMMMSSTPSKPVRLVELEGLLSNVGVAGALVAVPSVTS
jgi:hypothetical protein